MQATAYELRVITWVASRVEVVPVPLSALNLDQCIAFEDRVVTIFPFMPGAHADRHDAGVRATAAHLLAEVHTHLLAYPETAERPSHPRLSRYDWTRSALWDWLAVEAAFAGTDRQARLADFAADPEPARLIAELLPLLRDERANAARCVADLAANRRLLFAPIHGDFYRGNVLMLDGRISALLDWDDTRPEWLAWELARAAWEFSRTDNGFEPARAATFIHHYRAAGGPVNEAEDDVLLPLLRTVQVIEAMWALTDALRGRPWDPGYMAATNLRALEQLRTMSALA